jgi:hypothetical protein
MALNLRQRFATNAKAELEGAWVDLGEGAAIRVARYNNPRHKALRDRLLRPYRGLLLAGRDLPEDVEDRVAIECLAETILLDWRGLLDDQGQALAYDREVARGLLTSLRDFRETVAWHALQAETFRAAEVEAIAKN